jgi:hypothetical protein
MVVSPSDEETRAWSVAKAVLSTPELMDMILAHKITILGAAIKTGLEKDHGILEWGAEIAEHQLRRAYYRKKFKLI